MLFRLKLALLVGGGVLAYLGYQEYTLSQGASTEPEPVELAALEQGEEPPSAYIRLGGHWLVSEGAVYEYETSRFGSDEVTDSTEINYAYFPVVSTEHPYVVATDALAAQYGGFENIPDEEWPPFGDFRMVVKTTEYATFGRLPTEWLETPSVDGMIINKIGGLDAEERQLLQQSFPAANLDRLLVLDKGRTPQDPMIAMAMMGGGGILALGGLLWLLPRGSKKSKENPVPEPSTPGSPPPS